MLHRARKMNPDAIVAACGCYVQEKPEEVADCVDIVLSLIHISGQDLNRRQSFSGASS